MLCGIYDIKITDITTDNVKTYDNLSFNNGGKAVIDSIDSNHYKVEFTAKRTAGDKGFRLFFGKSDDKNLIQWFIGGWQNQDTEVNAQVNGRGSALTTTFSP